MSLLAALAATGCGTSPGTAAGIESAGKNVKAPAPDLRKVNTIVASQKPIEQLVVVTGTLAAEQEIVLGLKVPGRISDLPVDLGSTVQMGAIIARLDTTDFALRVRQSEAALQQARVRLGLPPDGTSEDVNLEQTALVREARAQMDSTKARLDRATQLFDRGLLAKADLDQVSGAYKVTEAQYTDALDEGKNRQGVLAQRRSELEIARQQLADAGCQDAQGWLFGRAVSAQFVRDHFDLPAEGLEGPLDPLDSTDHERRDGDRRAAARARLAVGRKW